MAKVKMAKPKNLLGFEKDRFATLTFGLYFEKDRFATLTFGLYFEKDRFAALGAPGGLPRIQRLKYRDLNEKLLAICNPYSTEFKVVDFQKRILQLIFCVPDYK